MSGKIHAPATLLPRKELSRYPLEGRLGGPQNWSGRRREKKSCSYWDSNSDLSSAKPVASRYTDCAIQLYQG
jgi:hypothetical protein